MPSQEKVEISITKDFKKSWDEFENLLKIDEDFIRIVSEKLKGDKRAKPGRQRSAKVRYAIAFYIRESKRKQLTKVGEQKDEET